MEETELPQDQVSSIKQDQEPTFTTQQTTNGYGLYGHGSTQIPSTNSASITREFRYANFPEKTPTEGYLGEGYQEKEVSLGHRGSTNYGYKTKQYGTSDARYMDDVNVNSNNGYESNQYDLNDASLQRSNDNGYKTKESGQSDSRVLDDGKISGNYVYETKQGTYEMDTHNMQQGLSDTRFMENGKYFYNVDDENSYLNKYQPVSRSYDGFRSSQRADSRNNYNNGNNQNAYEFDNSMGDSKYKTEQNQNGFSP